MEFIAEQLLTLGIMFMLGLAADVLGRRTRVPRVTLLVLCGLVFGSSGLGWIQTQDSQAFDLIGTMALVMVGFLLGGRLRPRTLKQHGRRVLQLSLSVVLTTIVCVAGGLVILSVPWPLALVLAGIATSTDPIATLDVLDQKPVREDIRVTLRAVVAIDDAWGLIAFSLLAGVAVSLQTDGKALELIVHGFWEVVGAVLLGIALGLPMGLLSGRVQPGEPTLVEALGIIFLAGGLALFLGVSYLLASMVLGMVVAMVGRHHRRAFHEIEHIEWPIMVLFFILAGASLRLEDLWGVGALGVAYIVLRILGRWLGGLLGCCGLEREPGRGGWAGLALLPQAGIALGTALLATQYLPEHRDAIMAVTVSATIFFELVGPPLTAFSLRRWSMSTE